MQRLAQVGHSGEEMLGVVQRQQHRQRRHRSGQRRQRLAMADVDAEGGRHGSRQVGRIGQVRELDPAHALRIGLAMRGEQVLRQQGLADAARADDADEAVAVEQRGQRIQFVGAPEQGGQLGRQVGAQPRRTRRQTILGGRRGRCRRRGGRLDRRHEAIAAPRNGGDQVVAQDLAQGADLRGQVVLLHHEPRPDKVHQHVLADQLAGPLGQRLQQVERAPPERRRRPVHEQATLVGLQFETAEAQGRRSPVVIGEPELMAQRHQLSVWPRFRLGRRRRHAAADGTRSAAASAD